MPAKISEISSVRMGTTRLTSRRRQDQGFKWARISMAVLATVGVIDTGSITLERWGMIGNLTCPVGADGCDKVLNSPWGTLYLNAYQYHIPRCQHKRLLPVLDHVLETQGEISVCP